MASRRFFIKGIGEVETDIYGCFHVCYDSDYKFEAVEVVYVDEADIYYDGEKVPETYDEVLEFFQKRYDDVEEDGTSFSSVQGSMGVYVEDADEYDAILFAKKGYYNELDIKDFSKIRLEFTTLLRQMKSSYDKYVVKEVKYDERKNYEERN